jgi:hypothetical protein
MQLSRRQFLGAGAVVGAAGALFPTRGKSGPATLARRYNLCISTEALQNDPELIRLIVGAGVTDVWLAGYLYGYWHFPVETIQLWRRRIEASGIAAHVVNVPLGHPGDSLGSKSGDFPLTPPTHWKPGIRFDGLAYAGTSLHPPATEENAEALRRLIPCGVKRVFLDDDFRLARGPGMLGGCFCDDHRARFLQSRGYAPARWEELIDVVGKREFTPLLREWCAFHCADLTGCFRALQSAAPGIDLGIMVMYMGAEKAGIALNEYHDALFRVGEMMFDNDSFGTPKNKCNELFSALFHRRFARPERTFSETTAFPSDRLSARNMSAKLAVSTLADVRNTMFMSGLTAFPRTHWDTLGPAMKQHAAINAKLAGHAPRGPFKHYWGDGGRYVSDDNPYSLFLASGVPFEVVDRLPSSGWTFLGDADAGLSGEAGTQIVCRPKAKPGSKRAQRLPESFEALFQLKREIAPLLSGVPYVEDDKPVVCAWYPSARSVLLWNLSEGSEKFTVRLDSRRREVQVEGLGVALLEGF